MTRFFRGWLIHLSILRQKLSLKNSMTRFDGCFISSELWWTHVSFKVVKCHKHFQIRVENNCYMIAFVCNCGRTRHPTGIGFRYRGDHFFECTDICWASRKFGITSACVNTWKLNRILFNIEANGDADLTNSFCIE